MIKKNGFNGFSFFCLNKELFLFSINFREGATQRSML